MFSRIRRALACAENHWLTDLAGVCLLFTIPPAVLFAAAVLGAAP